MPQIHPGYRTGYFYGITGYPDSRTSGYLYNGYINFMLTFVPLPVNLTRIGIDVSNGSSGSLRFGVYTNDPTNGEPKDLVFETSEIQNSSGMKEVSINWNPKPDWYWFAVQTTNRITVRARNKYEFDQFIHGINATIFDAYYLRSAYQYDQFPDQSPGWQSYRNRIPYMWFRRV